MLTLIGSLRQETTRAEVRADLVGVEQAGYRPAASDLSDPADVRAAAAKSATPESVSE